MQIPKTKTKMDEIQPSVRDIALQNLYENIKYDMDGNIDLAKQALIDLDRLKSTKPAKSDTLPDTIFHSLNMFLQMHGKSLDGPPTLFNIIQFSQLNSIFQSDDERLNVLNEKKDEFIMLTV